jgi:hypothetical protein
MKRHNNVINITSQKCPNAIMPCQLAKLRSNLERLAYKTIIPNYTA